MYCFTYKAHPHPTNLDHAKFGGAYVNCYIDYTDPDGARILAQHYIRMDNWIPDILDGEGEIIEPDDENRLYFAEAKEHGFSMVFHTWGVNAPDTNT